MLEIFLPLAGTLVVIAVIIFRGVHKSHIEEKKEALRKRARGEA